LNAAVLEAREVARKRVATACESPSAAVEPVRVALLGVGTVGKALLQRLDALAGSPITRSLQLVHVANSTSCFFPSPIGRGRREAAGEGRVCPSAESLRLSPTPAPLPAGEGLSIAVAALGAHGERILVDATASEEVAGHHAQWLAQGIHVVTACKLGQGTSLARWRAIRAACERGGAQYGDSATVGAGLPLLRSLRELRAGGDRIHAIAGVLSGSLAWLFNRYDGMRPFSALVRQAREAGYTEPDPREDLSGEDVRRKLLILARAAGFPLEADSVDVASLVPNALRSVAKDEVDDVLPLLDAPLRERYARALKDGEKLRFIARLESDASGAARARVGLEALSPDHPLAGGAGTDNRVAIWSDRYREQPLLIQGPGAGAQVTAAALLDDVLRIAKE
jgi:homoserine dehydrogenase